MDPEVEALHATLARREARLATYLRVRSWLGLLLLAIAAAAFGLAGVFALAAGGVLTAPELTTWTQGFDWVLAVFMPSALGWLAGRSGFAWWRHRHPGDPQPGCPVC